MLNCSQLSKKNNTIQGGGGGGGGGGEGFVNFSKTFRSPGDHRP